MKHLFLLTFFVLFSGFSVVTAAAQGTGTISGTVTFGADGRVLHQVDIRIVELRRNVVTDDAGHYEFRDIPAGRYTLLAHQEGFSDLVRNVVLTSGASETVNFTLEIGSIREQVTVTASGTEQSTSEAFSSVSTVPFSRIAERAAVGLGEVLDNQPGVAQRTLGPGSSRPVIRGFDGDRVLIANDGVRVGSLGSQSGDHGEPVDILGAERIEIVKGPATLLYGSNAIGGVVNTISGHDEGAHTGFRGYLTGIGGVTNRQGGAGAGLEYGWDRWMVWANGSGQRTGDYKAGGDFGRVENSFTRSNAASFGGGYYGNKGFINSTYSYYRSRFGIPLFEDDDEEEEGETRILSPADADGERSLRMYRSNIKVSTGYNDPSWAISGIRFMFNSSNYRHQELVEDEVGTTFRNKVYSYRTMFEQKRKDRWSGRFGFEGYNRGYEVIGDERLIEGRVKANSFSAFTLQELNYDRVGFQFGARVENNRYNPTDVDRPDRSFTGFSGSIGAKFRLWEGGSFVANYSNGYRAPALEELYNFGPHDGTLTFEIGDPTLKPERSNGIDLSLRHGQGRVRAEANFFYYNFQNFIFLAPTGEFFEEEEEDRRLIRRSPSDEELPIAEFRQGNSRFYGTELNLDVRANRFVSVFGGIDYVNAELTELNLPLPRITPLRGRIGLDLRYQGLSVRPELVAVAKQDRIYTNETVTDGYATFNVAASYVIPRQHVVNIFSVNAYNLNNKLYYNHLSFIKNSSPGIGRGVRFTYTVRFF